jgi:hypothetical protein
VVWDGEWKCLTSLGPGSALEFGLAAVSRLKGPEATAEVAKPMTLNFTPAFNKL